MQYFDFFDDESRSVLQNKIENTDIKLEDRVLYGFGITRPEYEQMVTKYAVFYNRVETLTKKNKK